MNSQRTIALTGGGTAGHVTPNLALAPVLVERGFRVEYIGSTSGIERSLCEEAGIPYHSIAVGKLRRYASWQNLTDPFRMLRGVVQAATLLGKLEARLVFSKGGYVGVPVAVGARLKGIPVVLHESDLSPGLANRLCIPLASRVCVSYAETLAALPKGARARHTGTPIRPSLHEGDRVRGIVRFELSADRPTILAFGGSLGARAINEAVRELVRLGDNNLQFIHVCGAGNLDPKLDGHAHYRQFEYMHAEFADALACSSLVISRGGSNSLAELAALKKPAIIVPLPLDVSRGDQIENARRHAEKGYGIVLPQSELSALRLRQEIEGMLERAEESIAAMERDAPPDSAEALARLIEELIETHG